MDALKNLVRLGYSRSWVVKKYSTIGLWPSEERLCRTYWRPGIRVLDLGCGAGRTTLPLARMGYRTTGADLASPMVFQARKHARRLKISAGWTVLDAADLPFADSSFGGILFSYNGIELVPGLEGKKQVLQEAWRVLEPGGHLIFTTHAIEAFNRYAFFRTRQFIRFCLSRLVRRPIPEMEIGEVICDPCQNVEVYYLQVVSPRIYRRFLAQIGFELIDYNSRRRIEAGRPPAWFVDFDPDFKCYVARKPGSPA